MYSRPFVAIVGRPNVGKSQLFNRILKKKLAIVDEAEGITRDRIYADAEAFGIPFTLIDTAGIDPKSEKQLSQETLLQTEIAISEADRIIMVVDAKVGVTSLDERVATLLHKSKKPLFLAINKIDSPEKESLIHPFYKLGISSLFPISAIHGLMIEPLLEKVLKGFLPRTVHEIKSTKVAIVGKPNVGKSTLLNALLGDERSIVSPIEGTTRDTIDMPISLNEKNYIFIDTAGLRRPRSEKESVDKFAAIRTENAIDRSDLVLLVLDAVSGLSQREKQILSHIEKSGKGCIVVMNKWDLIKGFRMEHSQKALTEKNAFLSTFPFLFISAKAKRNLEKLFPLIDQVKESLEKRLLTGSLNKFLERTLQANPPPAIKGRRLRIYYMTQVGANPPEFLLFCNTSTLMTDTYKKYLLNTFREHFGFIGTPIIFRFKNKTRQQKENSSRVLFHNVPVPLPVSVPEGKKTFVSEGSED